MKRTTLLTLGAAATVAVIGVIAIPAIAQGWGSQQMMRMMHGTDGAALHGPHGAGPMMMHGNRGSMGARMGGMGPMGGMADNPVYRSFDADGDGTVTAQELEAGLAALHARHDTDGNGSLSAEEFAALFADVTRVMAERPFAMLDADGDGQISAAEMAFPAQMMARMQAWHGTAPGAGTEQN